MRHVIILDTKIGWSEYETWLNEDKAFWEKYMKVTPTYEVIQRDFHNYPTTPDSDGDERPVSSFLAEITSEVESIYGPHGADFIILAIHETNWKSDPPGKKGIWGTNYSYLYGQYMLQYCRWDKDNAANTFGTIYHERHHSFDALARVEAGKEITGLIGVSNWDRDCTHGKSPNWAYIRHKENTEALRLITPTMQQVFAIRKKRHDDWIAKKKSIIILLKETLRLMRILFNIKNGVPRQ